MIISSTFTLSLLLFVGSGNSQSTACKQCSASYFDYSQTKFDCFDQSVKETCSADGGYCQTTFKINKGIVHNVERECLPKTPIPVVATTCVAENCSETICKHVCSGANCNKLPQSDKHKRCSSGCGGKDNGYCDHIAGKCVCNSGRAGPECELVPRKCVQCGGDSGCTQSSTPETCDSTQMYCVKRKGLLLDNVGKVVKTVVSRSCSDKIYDGCCLDTQNDGPLRSLYTAFTCSVTCDKDGCNTGSVDIYPASIRKPLKCIQCGNSTHPCTDSIQATWCPSNRHYCYGELEYIYRKNYKTEEYEYKVLTLNRGCTEKPREANGCKEKEIAERGLTYVSCYETCKEYGCNDGWAGRPKCVQCKQDYTKSKNTGCLSAKQSDAKICPTPLDQYCYLQKGLKKTPVAAIVKIGAQYTQMDPELQSYNITRGCRQDAVPWHCTFSKNVLEITKVCEETCDSHGCNSGSNIAVMGMLMTTMLLYSLIKLI